VVDSLTNCADASVLQCREIALVGRPKASELSLLRTWITSPHLGGGCNFLGRDLGGFVQEMVYEDSHKDDVMMLLTSRGEDDPFTRFLSGPILKLFHWFWRWHKAPLPLDPENPAGAENRSGLHHYSDAHIQMVVSIIGTVATSLFPMSSIIALFFVKNLLVRLGLVCVFTLLFSLGLALGTRARRIEIFAATAAFAGILVVFVGSTSGGV